MYGTRKAYFDDGRWQGGGGRRCDALILDKLDRILELVRDCCNGGKGNRERHMGMNLRASLGTKVTVDYAYLMYMERYGVPEDGQWDQDLLDHIRTHGVCPSGGGGYQQRRCDQDGVVFPSGVQCD